MRIQNPVDASKVQCYGPGLDAKGVVAGVPVSFTVDATEAGEAPLQVTYTDQTGNLKTHLKTLCMKSACMSMKWIIGREARCQIF